MNKKLYILPQIKVKSLDAGQDVLAASDPDVITIKPSDEEATDGYADAKGADGITPSSVWDD